MKTVLLYISGLLLSAGLFLNGCNGLKKQKQETRLARVGNKYLTLDEALSVIPAFLLEEDSLQALASYRKEWIREMVIQQETERLRLRQKEAVLEELKKAEQEVLAQALKDYVIGEFNKDLTVTDEEARNYYQANKDKFVLDERHVRFRHVETPDLESARAAKRELMAGIPWPEVAHKYSLTPEVKINQSEQFWPVSVAVADLDIMNRYLDGVIGLTEISPIQRVNRNYHFVQLMESKPKGGHPDLNWLIEQIRDWLIIEKRRRHYSSYVKNLYLKAQSNNEIESYNVLIPKSNPQTSNPDTLESTSTSK